MNKEVESLVFFRRPLLFHMYYKEEEEGRDRKRKKKRCVKVQEGKDREIKVFCSLMFFV